jgi:hypothetical protein
MNAMDRKLEQREPETRWRLKDIEVREMFSTAFMTISVGLHESHFMIARLVFGSAKNQLDRSGLIE